jgi:hypothetical protein
VMGGGWKGAQELSCLCCWSSDDCASIQGERPVNEEAATIDIEYEGADPPAGPSGRDSWPEYIDPS